MRRVLGAGAALVCVALLSSCALLPLGPRPGSFSLDDSAKKADAEMQRIADAVKNHDAAALKKLFSNTAREKATDLDSGLKYSLSVFPSGFKSWKLEGGAPGEGDEIDLGKSTVVLLANYRVSANGRTYELYFADYTSNQVGDAPGLGLYALGVEPYNAHPFAPSGALWPFDAWAKQFGFVDHKATGIPGIYVPQK